MEGVTKEIHLFSPIFVHAMIFTWQQPRFWNFQTYLDILFLDKHNMKLKCSIQPILSTSI